MLTASINPVDREILAPDCDAMLPIGTAAEGLDVTEGDIAGGRLCAKYPGDSRKSLCAEPGTGSLLYQHST